VVARPLHLLAQWAVEFNGPINLKVTTARPVDSRLPLVIPITRQAIYAGEGKLIFFWSGHLKTVRSSFCLSVANRKSNRSSLNVKIATLRQIGGVNSIDNFARSWQRAAAFHEIAPVRPSFRLADGEEGDDPSYTKGHIEASSNEAASRSLLRQQFQEYEDNDGRRSFDHAVIADDGTASDDPAAPSEDTHLLAGSSSRFPRIPSSWTDSIFSVEPSLASGIGASYGTLYASRASRPRRGSVLHAAQVFREEQIKQVGEGEPEQEPLLIKHVEEDGLTYSVVVGQSTLPQTVFNSINVLIGVGLLSLPLGLRYSGWVIGMLFFCFAVVTTRYTAKLLAKCLDVDNSLITFADLAYVSFGPRARIATSLLFSLELIAACVALVILFADSLNALVPGYSILAWKVLCGICLVPLSFLPLRLLGFTSILGILSCMGSKRALWRPSFVLALHGGLT
jgi:vesicular inhibitory amino acid transporter